jgi:hypothetical protein
MVGHVRDAFHSLFKIDIVTKRNIRDSDVNRIPSIQPVASQFSTGVLAEEWDEVMT